MFEDSLINAVIVYMRRQERLDHPSGEFDNAKRWEPSASEFCDCCESIRSPSRSWPHSLNKHCRSAEHVAQLFKVSSSELRRLSNLAKKQRINVTDEAEIRKSLIAINAAASVKTSKKRKATI